MTVETLDFAAWQASWDSQQEAFMPDREERIAAMLGVVEAVTPDRPPRVLDLAGGTGSISLRLLARWPNAETVVLDADRSLLTIARGSLGDRGHVVAANLGTSGWLDALPYKEFDAVLTATALHWINSERLRELYAEVRGVLRTGGVFMNADHMEDPGIPGLTAALASLAQGRRNERYDQGVDTWPGWWERFGHEPAVADLVRERNELFGGNHAHTDFNPDVTWHLEALRSAGFAEAGLIWRGHRDATFAAVR
ncbi:class I SAM-dependent methyltransferase [Fodinicola feengrottensis]|uniref:Class I SAM-dependent methyltransferase n=1 Tax=Fodinicola feengrottensis TaxID=435914 RepID=A0ABN2I411_9ACTN|nr:class I SAM-dependent methyltransferase [Fodinicola feengrottensis]